MIIRRAFFYWQFAAVVVLPVWLVVGWPIFGAGGWAVLGVFLGAVVLGLAMLIVALLFTARKQVRAERAVSWADAGVLALWHALIIAVGFYASASPWLSILVIVVGAAAFWFAIWELIDAARQRMRAVMDDLEQAARPAYLQSEGAGSFDAGTWTATPGNTRATTVRPESVRPDPNVIIIEEKPTP
ncbi:hypothetical protein [Glaciibacter superstes]|uniref:hypothetical protein n=1 Tax=Glaciibacter superstes TaxID=501023 RepID=UPI0003B3A49B|nr:hypothetical protein [Glaciibacter superstes]